MLTFFTGVVSNTMFQAKWKDLRNDIVEIEQQVLGGHLYEQRFDNESSANFFDVLAKVHVPFSGKNFSNNQYNQYF